MKILLSHSGKQHSYYVAQALDRQGQLSKFVTSSYITNLWLQQKLKNDPFWSRRFLLGLGGDAVESNWKYEIREFYLRKRFGKGEMFQEAVFQRDQNFDKDLANRLHKYDFDAFWGFQGSCLETLKKAKSLGVKTFYESATICHKELKKIIEEEINLNPEWKDNFLSLNFPKHIEERLEAEPQVSDTIIVASEYSKRSYVNNGFSVENIKVLPLGVDLDLMEIPNKRNPKKVNTLKVLYVGTITQNKGVKYMFDAIQKINSKNIELTCIGHIQGDGDILKQYKDHFKHIKFIPQDKLFQLYTEYDVLISPSLYEGFGFTIIEAMFAGLPIIATQNSIAQDIVKNGENGFIVPIRDAEAIEKTLISLAEMNSDEFDEMSKNAHNSIQRFTWDSYQNNLTRILSC